MPPLVPAGAAADDDDDFTDVLLLLLPPPPAAATASPCHRYLVSLHPSLLGDRATTPNYLRICRNNLE